MLHQIHLLQKNVARGKTDPAWGHCKHLELDTNGRGQFMCLYCNKVFNNRFKKHLAGIKEKLKVVKK